MPQSSTPSTPSVEEQYEKRARAARWLAKQGFGIVLLPVPTPGGCGCSPKSSTRDEKGECRSPGKHPIGDEWEKNAVHTDEEIDALVKTALRPLRQFGIFPEVGSRLMILDEDAPGRLAEVAKGAGLEVPPTFGVWTSVAPTGERKKHLYWRLPDGFDAGSVPKTWIGGEIRVNGSGQVVGPYSKHTSGAIYEPFGREIAVIPAELIVALNRGAKAREKVQTEDTSRPIMQGEGRHEFLLQQARHLWKGGVRGEALVVAVEERNQTRCNPPYPRDEVVRICEWAEKNLDEPLPGVTLNVPGVAGAPSPVRVIHTDEYDYDAITEPRNVGEFPFPVDGEAYSGSVLAAYFTGELAQITSGARVGYLAALMSIWGGMFGSRFDLYEDQPTNIFSVLVGDTASGRKGTTTRTAWSAIEQATIGSGHLMGLSLFDHRWDGLASGQGFIRQMSVAKVKKGIAIEEEFENVLRAAKSTVNYGSTLGTTIQKAFDGAILQHITVKSSTRVDPPYTVGILGNITREVLRKTMPTEFIAGGFANRVLWVPVSENTEIKPRGGGISPGLKDAIRDAIDYSQTDPEVRFTDPARDLVNDYFAYLRGLTGTPALFVRRLHVIAARIAAIHALMDQERFIRPLHVMSGIALTEYSRRGLMWSFGFKTGDEWLDVVVEALRGVAPEGLPTRVIARMLQNNAPRISRVREIGVESGLIVIGKGTATSFGSGRPPSLWKASTNNPLGDFVRAGQAWGGDTGADGQSLADTTNSTVEIEQMQNNPLSTTSMSLPDDSQTDMGFKD